MLYNYDLLETFQRKVCPIPAEQAFLDAMYGSGRYKTTGPIFTQVSLNSAHDHVTFSLHLPIKETHVTIASGNLFSVPANCSALLLTQLQVNPRLQKKGFGTYLLNQMLEYAQKAGYSFVQISCAGEGQHLALERFFSKFDFIPVGVSYKNNRTSNLITWAHKIMHGTRLEDDTLYSQPKGK